MGDDDLLISCHSPSWPVLRLMIRSLSFGLGNQWEIHGVDYFPYRV